MSCEECGFDEGSVSPETAPTAIRAFARRYRAPLTRFLPGEDGDSLLRRRPEPDVWCALEYAAHVRDVFDAYESRVRLILTEDRPELRGFEPDELAAERLYAEDDPAAVAEALAANAESLAAVLEGVPDDGWERVGLRSGEERSVLATARQAVHEGNHHLLDVGRVLRAVRGTTRS